MSDSVGNSASSTSSSSSKPTPTPTGTGSDGNGDGDDMSGMVGGHNSTTGNSSNDNKGDGKGDGKDDGKGDDKDGDDDSDDDDGDNSDKNGGSGATKPSNWKPTNSTTIANGVPLRIMCLGASIIRGELSSDANGFRKTLRGDLAGLGAPINMVGSQRNGDMPDNDFEAYGGNRVKQIHDHATKVVPEEQPNVFVINVGTNNVLQRRDVEVAGEHMEAFIDYLLRASPRSTVVLSTLLTNTVPNREPLILDINDQFRTLFASKYAGKKAVVLAELHPSEGLPGRPTTDDISSDGSHPTDNGYEIMGHILADAIKEADSKGYLRWPGTELPYDGEAERLDSTGGEDDTELPAPTQVATR